MATKIAVLSLTRGLGETTVTTLVAKSIAMAADLKNVCITVAGDDYSAMREYNGIPTEEDPTTSSAYLLSMLRTGESNNLRDYAEPICTGVDAVIPSTTLPSARETEELHRLIVKQLDKEYDYIVTDLAVELGSPTAQWVYENYDLIFIMLAQNISICEKLKEWRGMDSFPPENKVIYLINRYDAEICNSRATFEAAGLSRRVQACTIPYLPQITIAGNNGYLTSVCDGLAESNPARFEMRMAMRELLDRIVITLIDPDINLEI